MKDEYKGKGIGTKIINQLKDYAREKGYKGISVSVMCGMIELKISIQN